MMEDEKWKIIRDTVVSILNKVMSQYSFQQVHHSVFKMCQQQGSGLLFDHLEAILTTHVNSIRDRLLSVTDENFFISLKTEWDDFSSAVNFISKTLLYLNNNYTCHRQSISQMGESLFCEVVLRNAQISEMFSICVRGSFTSDKTSKNVLKELVSRLSQSYRHNIFEPYIEDPFIAVLLDQYRQEMGIKLNELGIKNYLEWVFGVIEELKTNVSDILGESTAQRVEKSLGILLIKENTTKLLYDESGGGSSMFRGMETQSLHLLAEALGKVNESEAFLDMIINTAKKMGSELLADVDNASPVSAVEKILNLRDRIKNLILNLPFISKSNQSPVTQALTEIVKDSAEFAENLAYYYDAKVKSKLSEAELERLVADVFGLFRLLRTKEVFDHAFKLLLAARLINSKPEDPLTNETFLIDQIRNECGESFNHLEIMIKDGRMRREMNKGFIRSLGTGNKLPYEFYVTVITAGVWPEYTDLAPDLPESMQNCMQLFRSYYLPHHNGRKLSFNTTLGTVIFTLNHGKIYELVAPTAFASTILCFQNSDQNNEYLSLQEICDKTKLIERDASLQLESLSQLGLISVDRANDVLRYAFNQEFNNPKSKLRVRTTNGNRILEKNRETRAHCESLGDSISFSIQAAAIQIIKSKRRIVHTELCNAITKSLQAAGFAPSMADIKKGLETLMSKGLISRGRSSNVYTYES
ncbi:cullin-like protein, putative [Trypanosoma cruzi marinkellei]|uniref:Cullin-like protein, putative n=1 Tax=Trypanosoma cruzi marinkellei TaxID=85056 RepID=K2N9M2_TRYCR|nr:cullin-like protein, putative [Trypanosoma cruzi marinkellei]